MCCLCGFYSFYNKYACFAFYENYFFFLSALYYFTETDALEPQSSHIDFCAFNLFTTCFGVINLLSVLFLHVKQCVFYILTYALKTVPRDSW